jgi:predicted O-methyltransferase YrrM
VRKGGLIAVDNTLWSGAVIDRRKQSENTRALRLFNGKIAADPRVDIALLAIGDGLTLARKR